jgi:hydrogenase nickel incorporation protein HypB
MFRKVDLVLLTKVDLLPQLPEISVDRIAENLTLVMPKPAMLVVSAKTGAGIDEWIAWLRGQGRPRLAECTGAAAAGAFV